jgi:hypothetical protein
MYHSWIYASGIYASGFMRTWKLTIWALMLLVLGIGFIRGPTPWPTVLGSVSGKGFCDPTDLAEEEVSPVLDPTSHALGGGSHEAMQNPY